MGKPQKMSSDEVKSGLEKLSGWSEKEGKLFKEYSREDFVDAFGFLTRIAIHAEKMNHHPEIFNVYKTVQISLSTHDCNGISELDFQLARAIDAVE